MVSVEPWSKRGEIETPSERRLGRLFEAVPEPEALPELSRQRVKLRLQRGASPRPALMLLRLVAVGTVIGICGAAAAQLAISRLWVPQHELAHPPVARAVESSSPVLPPHAPTTRAPEAASLPAASATFAPLPAAAPAQSSRLGLEAASLQAALSTLRSGATERALTALDEHRRAFPRGALDLEARVARVEVLLKLGRRQEAKSELSALPLESVGRKLELRLIRAELRAEDDCRSALRDFQVLLDQSLPAAWTERALFGRGACLLKLGDEPGASRDFARYLERFPNGRFSAQIRAQGASVNSAGR